MESAALAYAGAVRLPLCVKNTFLEVMDQECDAPRMNRRASAPALISVLPDASEAYPSFDSKGPVFFSEGAVGFGTDFLSAFPSEGTDVSDEDGPDFGKTTGVSSGNAASGAGADTFDGNAADAPGAATSGGAGAGAFEGQPEARGADAFGDPAARGAAAFGDPAARGEDADHVGNGGGLPEPVGAGEAGAPAAEAEARPRRPRGGKRPCRGKRERCQGFVAYVQRSFAENPNLDVDQIEMPVFLNTEWLRRRAEVGIEGVLNGAPPVGGRRHRRRH